MYVSMLNDVMLSRHMCLYFFISVDKDVSFIILSNKAKSFFWHFQMNIFITWHTRIYYSKVLFLPLPLICIFGRTLSSQLDFLALNLMFSPESPLTL